MNRKKFGKNPNGGRDFVIGDLHGAYPRLMQFMEFINFDKSKDRMFSVGDLVDRGTHNLECLMLTYEPWFHHVYANHEQLMCEFMDRKPYGAYWSFNGGAWGVQYRDEQSDIAMQVRDACKKIEEAPLMITVEKQDGGHFHIIHAELAGVGPLSDEMLDDEKIFEDVAFYQSMDGDYILWGRYIFYDMYKRNMTPERIAKYLEQSNLQKRGAMFTADLSHIYSGHTIMMQPTRFMGQTNLDTGAYYSLRYDNRAPEDWAALTVTEPLTDRFWQARESGVLEVKPLIIA